MNQAQPLPDDLQIILGIYNSGITPQYLNIMKWHNQQQQLLLRRLLEQSEGLNWYNDKTTDYESIDAVPASVIEAELERLQKDTNA